MRRVTREREREEYLARMREAVKAAKAREKAKADPLQQLKAKYDQRSRRTTK